MPTASGTLTSSEMRELTALVKAQAEVRSVLSETAMNNIARAMAAINDFWDPKQTTKAATEAAKIIQAQQKQMARTTDAYLARTTSIVTGKRVNPVGAVDVAKTRRKLPEEALDVLARADTSREGAGPALNDREMALIERAMKAVGYHDPASVYGRVADDYRYRTSSGLMDEVKARAHAETRAKIMADTDLMLTDRAQIARFMTERKPNNTLGYRRVLHPELAGGGPPCGLCVVAADRVYKYQELMPLHARCRCTVMVVGSRDDAGQRLNNSDLRAIYRAAGGIDANGVQRTSTFAADLKKIRVEVVEHGEYGPWLINPTQRFRGPREAAKAMVNDTELNALSQIEALQENLDVLRGRLAAGEPGADEAIRWHQYKLKFYDRLIPR